MSSPEGDAEALAHSDSVVDLTGPSSQDGSSPESAQVATMECEPNSAEESSPSPDVAVSTAGTDGNEGGLVVPDGAALSPDMTPQASGPASPVGVSLDAPPLGAAETMPPDNASPSRENGGFSALSRNGSTTEYSSLDPDDRAAADARHAAWPIPEAARSAIAARSGETVVSADVASYGSPGLSLDTTPVDLVEQLATTHGVTSLRRRTSSFREAQADAVTLRQLMQEGSWCKALQLTTEFLSAHGQGVGQGGQPTPALHTHRTMQVWFARSAALVRLKMFTVAISELDSFGSFDRPDLFYEYYPDTYPGRSGSLVPFALRLLHAQLPSHTGRQQDALDRLYGLMTTVQTALANLENGCDVYGEACPDRKAADTEADVALWRQRERQLLHSISNCFILLDDYVLAAEVLEDLLQKDPRNFYIPSALGRLALYLGDARSANRWFMRATELCGDGASEHPCMLMNNGFLAISKNAYETGTKIFTKAMEKMEASNKSSNSAANNIAVCHLYRGSLNAAISFLNGKITELQGVNPSLVFNLCTLFELESSHAVQKKKALIPFVMERAPDGFGVDCLKL